MLLTPTRSFLLRNTRSSGRHYLRCERERTLIHPQKPTVANDVAAERMTPQQSSPADLADRLRDEMTQRLQGVPLLTQPVIQKLAIEFQSAGAVIALGGEDAVGGNQSRLDGRADAFAAFRIRQAGGIPDQQNGVVQNCPFRVAEEPVRVSQNSFAGHFDVSAALEKAKELVAVLGEAVIIHAADADGEDIL